ncbi:MAG: GxGYxYP domain-containing protein, partial [Limisphaerales bacterium]
MAASGLFPKMPPVAKVYVVNCLKDSRSAKRTAWALQGLINQSYAEVYVLSSGEHKEQLKFSGKSFEMLAPLDGKDAGLRTLFQKYQGHVKKMFVYDPKKDWTWYLAQMEGAQQDGIPVTEPLEHDLTSEFGWKGKVEDFRNKWTNRIEAYDWALTNLMPAC